MLDVFMISHLHVVVDEEVESVEVEEAGFSFKFVFNRVKAVQHDVLHLGLWNTNKTAQLRSFNPVQ